MIARAEILADHPHGPVAAVVKGLGKVGPSIADGVLVRPEGVANIGADTVDMDVKLTLGAGVARIDRQGDVIARDRDAGSPLEEPARVPGMVEVVG